jgi:plastocyanin
VRVGPPITAAIALLLFAAPAVAGSQTVTVRDFLFAPAEVRVEPGETVTWSFAGAEPHTSTSDPGQSETWGSPRMSAGTFSHTFTRPGRFTYFCQVHPEDMRGVVQVGAPSLDTAAPRIRGLRASPSRPRRATRLLFSLSEPATVRVSVARSGRPGVVLRRLRRSLPAGRRSIRLRVRGLSPGSYRAALRATDAAGNRSRSARVRFRVVR